MVTNLDRTWEDHVAIDPDRAYGIDLRYIDLYELKKFGAYAEDGQTTRMFTSGGFGKLPPDYSNIIAANSCISEKPEMVIPREGFNTPVESIGTWAS